MEKRKGEISMKNLFIVFLMAMVMVFVGSTVYAGSDIDTQVC